MIAGLSGSLLSQDALSGGVGPFLGVPHDEPRCAAARRRLRALQSSLGADLGPASGPRAVFDRVAVPLATELGFRVTLTGTGGGPLLRALLYAGGVPAAALLVTGWGHDPAGAWRDGVRHGIGSGVRWCFCITGPLLRVLDARRTYARRYLEFDLDQVLRDSTAFSILWGLLRAEAFSATGPLLDRAVIRSEAHRAEVRASLQHGVHDALASLIRAFAAAHRARRRTPPGAAAIFDESLVVIYRILFLLFAEARGVVPQWHPVYRGSYTIESLRPSIETLPRPRGLWESLQAIARLAHRGCRAGSLRVPPFNGRLFSPVHAPLAESIALDDGTVREALLALTTRPGRTGRQRIAYSDLGVEQLGGVYERVLDFEPLASGDGAPRIVAGQAGRRKATGSFYTPRALTEYVVRRALAPLVHSAPPESILALRVLDPAMGSGAFLVAACRYLATAYETALIRDGVVAAADLTEHDRAGFRRAVAQRCLFGVDINPMAVQLGRLSLWLATLAGDRPLTFLDHHLRTGNSLVGASLADVVREPRRRRGAAAGLPLFDLDGADAAIEATIGPRLTIAEGSGDTIEQVREKERLLSSLAAGGAPLARWKTVADLWCSAWFGGNGAAGPRARHATFGALVDQTLGRAAVLPEHVATPLLDQAQRIAGRERFFHWTLEFPEVFHGPDGGPVPAPGFDAIVGNPPWEMLRGDRGEADRHGATGEASARLTEFTRRAGVYALQGDGHANLYQLFLERTLTLVRAGGRLGIVLPSGFASDHGCAALRRQVIDRCRIDTFVSIENRDAVFPIHRGLKFLLVTATTGAATTTLPCRFGVRSPDVLDELPDLAGDPNAVGIPRSLLERVSGAQLAIPELRTPLDLAIASRLAFTFPALGEASGWNVAFGRELNATDDRGHFIERAAAGRATRKTGPRYPVIEGKHIQPFTVDVAASRFAIAAAAAAALLDRGRTYDRPRLAYRDVAAATNRQTLIAAIVPAEVITTHTLFCLKGNIADDVQQFLCGIFNSYVANYLVRLRVSTHVTVSIVERLAVPVVARDGAAFRDLASLARRLSAAPDDRHSAAALQAHVARLYRLTAAEFQHVLDSFPLVPAADRALAMTIFAPG